MPAVFAAITADGPIGWIGRKLSEFVMKLNELIGLELAAIVAGVVVACWQIGAQRKLTKQNNSINKMWALQADGNLRDSMNSVAKMSADGENVASYGSLEKFEKNTGKNGWDEESRKKSRALNEVVDYFELVSIGVQQNIYDKKIIRIYARDIFVKMFDRVEPFIIEMRESHYSAYGENFQSVAEEFAKESDAEK